MTDAQQLLRPLRPGLVPVPAADQPGICRLCHSSCPPEYEQCYPCREAEQLVGAVEILPVSMSVEGAFCIVIYVATKTIAIRGFKSA